MRISDWSSDVCSSDLQKRRPPMRGSPFFFLALPVQKDGADVRSDLAREDRDRVVEVGQHPLDRRFPLGDDLVGAIEFEQPDGSESWRDVNVGRLAGESGPRDAVLNDAEDRKSTRLN